MTAHTFVHDHYSADVGESPTGHAVAILAGLLLILIAIGLAMTIAFLPVAVTVGLLGLFMMGIGVVGHIRGPLKAADLLEMTVNLAGMAISLTFTLAVALMVIGFVATIVVLIIDWLKYAF